MQNKRVQKLLASLPKDFEAAIIGTAVNRFYLLDFDAHDAGTLLVLPDRLIYIIDSRYIEQARRRVSGAQVVLQENVMSQLTDFLAEAGAKRVYLEDGITLTEHRRLKKEIPNVDFVVDDTLSSTILALRSIKDSEEIGRIRHAQRITDEGFKHILPYIKEGVREIDIALELEHFMRKNGAEQMAFPTICVAGANSSLPHGVPGEYRLKRGDFITMDFGAKYMGYAADMTRTVALGQPSEAQRRVYDTVLRAHLAGIEAAAQGAKCAEVDARARGIIYKAGYEGKFGHGLGHAVGVEVHEAPRLSPKSSETLQSGMVVTIEPGIYLEGEFGCRIEDMVLITQEGCEPLATSPKELIVL